MLHLVCILVCGSAAMLLANKVVLAFFGLERSPGEVFLREFEPFRYPVADVEQVRSLLSPFPGQNDSYKSLFAPLRCLPNIQTGVTKV